MELLRTKETAKFLLNLPIEPLFAGICCHPFTNSVVVYHNGKYYDLLKNEDLLEWKNIILNAISVQKDVKGIFMMINKPYLLLFLKLMNGFINNKLFSNLLADAWTISENPNNDPNVPVEEIIDWFKQADKKELMTSKDYKLYNSFPTEIEVYRGVAVGRNPKGLSYTTNYEKALWFANRFNLEDKKGYIIKRKIKKEDILAYFNTRSEDEVVVDISKYEEE